MKIQKTECAGETFLSLASPSGLTLVLTPFGAGIREVLYRGVPMTLSPATDADYLHDHVFFYGKTIGPIAGRIDRGRFPGLESEFALPVNPKTGVTLHSESLDYAFRRFDFKIEEKEDGARVVFSSVIPACLEYPATLEVEVSYFLSETEPAFTLSYFARPNRVAPIHLTNHVYWNLGGKDDAKEATLQILADRVVSYDDRLLPKEKVSVEGSPLDLRAGKKAEDVAACFDATPLGGIDHGFYVNERSLAHPTYFLTLGEHSLSIATTAKAFQVYSYNFPVEGSRFSSGVRNAKRIAVTSEPVLDSTTMKEDFLFSPAHPFHTETLFRFATKKE